MINIDEIVKGQNSDDFVKSSQASRANPENRLSTCRAYRNAAITKDAAQHSIRTFYEAVNIY
jgi:hypothetical protein